MAIDTYHGMPLRFWVQKVLPLVYDDSLSYYELLGKIVVKLNELIENNNDLAPYIQNEISNQLQGEEFSHILQGIIANFMVNVKYPPEGITPAAGDGATDDTEAIQGCIDYVYNNGGGAVYIPSGIYLTGSITLKENVSLTGFDRYKAIFTLKGGATEPLVTAQGGNTVANITLNGNSASQTYYQPCIVTTGEDHLLYSCIFDGGKYGVEDTSTGHMQMSDIIVPSCLVTGLYEHGSAQVEVENFLVETISAVQGQAGFIINNSNGTYQIGVQGSAGIGAQVQGDRNYIQLRAVNSITDYSDTGTGNEIKVEGKLSNIEQATFDSLELEFGEALEEYPVYNSANQTLKFKKIN